MLSIALHSFPLFTFSVFFLLPSEALIPHQFSAVKPTSQDRQTNGYVSLHVSLHGLATLSMQCTSTSFHSISVWVLYINF